MKRQNLLWGQCKHLISLLRLEPFDTSAPEGRANERHRRIVLTAIFSAAAKGVNVLTVLISVPLTVKYLGAERYGLWMTISSVIAILGFADLGMGNGLLNAISEANGKDDRQMAQEYVSSTFFMLSGVAIILGILFIIVYPLVSWQGFFHVSSAQAVAEAGPAMYVFVYCFLINIPLGIIQRVQTGYQEGFINNLWQGAGNLLGLAGVLVVINLKGGLPWLVLAMAGAPAFVAFLNGIILFRLRRPWLCPDLRKATSEAAKRIIRLGVLFFLLQIAAAFAFSSDNIVAAQILGPKAVTLYSISMKLFGIAPMILSMVLYPLWPAYGESISRGDIVWVKKTLKRSFVAAILITGVPSLILALFGVQIIRLWVGPAMIPPLILLAGFAVSTTIQAGGNAVAMFLNGSNIIGVQTGLALLMSVSAIIAKIVLAKKIGLPGIVWGTIIAYVIFTAIPLGFYVPRLLHKLTRID
jgi:O-antigen/teichoic acid export membrane protein